MSLDTDFLSAFLKIDRLALIRDFYGVGDLLIPPAVYREVSMTDLLPKLASLPWVRIQMPASSGSLVPEESFANLGKGEREAILLARQHGASLLLVRALQEKDHYGFRADVLDRLLS